MKNIAVLILILMYVGICLVVVGYWAFGTISNQEKSIQDKLDIDTIELDELDKDNIL